MDIDPMVSRREIWTLSISVFNVFQSEEGLHLDYNPSDGPSFQALLHSRAGDIRAQLDPFTEKIQRYSSRVLESGDRRDP